jgi:hypothetical protein
MKNSYKVFLTGSLLLTVLCVSPLAGFAQGNSNNKGKNKDVAAKVKVIKAEDENKKSASSTSTPVKGKKCIQAWGHLIAPGWIKKNGNLQIGVECHLPFGIGKKFGGNATTTPPGTTTPPTADITAPVIININATSTEPTKATVRWMTNENADSTIWYSTVSPVNISGAASIVKTNKVLNHTINIENLTASTTYYVIVQSRDAAGNTSTSSQISFVTRSAPPVVAPTPVISNVVAIVGTSTVRLGWSTDLAADSQVFYSTTSPAVIGATSTIALSDSTLVTDHIVNVSGLATSTMYSFIIRSKTSADMTQTTLPFTLTTSSGL